MVLQYLQEDSIDIDVCCRLGTPSQRELTAMQLSHYINALWATYQNPRHFHDHNLLAILDKYLAQVRFLLYIV